MGKKSRNIFVICAVLPALLATIIFVIYPTIRVFILSLTDANSLGINSKFVGLENYKYMLTDKSVWSSLKNTLFFLVVSPIVTLFFALLYALLITQGKLKEKSFYRILFFIPNILSVTVIAILWSFIYNPSIGIVNSFLKIINLEGLAHAWLGEKETVLWAVLAVMVWQAVGYYMVMYISGIDSIPKDLYEAARLDGANTVQQFHSITIPFLWEVIRVSIVFVISSSISWSFQLTNLMTNGGPAGSSMVLNGYIYKQGIGNGNFGYSMAIAVLATLITFIISIFTFKFTEKDALEF